MNYYQCLYSVKYMYCNTYIMRQVSNCWYTQRSTVPYYVIRFINIINIIMDEMLKDMFHGFKSFFNRMIPGIPFNCFYLAILIKFDFQFTNKHPFRWKHMFNSLNPDVESSRSSCYLELGARLWRLLTKTSNTERLANTVKITEIEIGIKHIYFPIKIRVIESNLS